MRDIILPAHVSEKIVQHEFVFRACMGRSVIGVPSNTETSGDLSRVTSSRFQPLLASND